MTINRLYNFTPGDIIQSSQVNSELDQILSTLNTYVLNSNYTSNNFVSDGNVVSAVSALDSNLTNASKGGLLSTNYSKNLILRKDSSLDTTVKIIGTALNPIVYANYQDVFVEDGTKSLDVTSVGNNQFIDIYIDNDTNDTPAIDSTKAIKLVGKSASITPYSTSASTGQHIVGCVYVKNNKIIGVNSIETPNGITEHSAIWGVSEPFNYLINSTTASYSTNEIYVPVFMPSYIHYKIETQNLTTGSGNAWNFDIYIKNNLTLSHYIRNRLPTLPVSSNEGRVCMNLIKRDGELSPGLYTYQIGGKLNSDDASVCNIIINWVYAHFTVYPSMTYFNARA